MTMSADGLQGLREDVAFMRSLAEQGRQAPLLGGSILAFAGAVFAPASLVHWGVVSERIDLGPWALNVVWLSAAAVFFAALFVLKGRMRRSVGFTTSANRANGQVWGGLGVASFALWGAFITASVRSGDWTVMDMFSVVILALYGAGWTVAAALFGRRWLNLVASAALILAVAAAWFVGRPEFYLVYAAALVLTALLPGLALMRQARAEAA
jgi:hypothetical protein